MSAWVIIVISVAYLLALFLLAYVIDNKAKSGNHLIKYKWVYALAIPVYCTAWTFYGSVGKAVTDGWEFLTIYIGPILTMPLWWIIMRKIIRICEVQRISTLPDFIAARYGKSVLISVLSSFFIILGIIPYISIQLKSITSSFDMLTYGTYQEADLSTIFLSDSAFYLSIILALFIILFVFRTIETTDKHYGLMGAIAIDSIIKLIAFLAVGLFVTYGLFNGFSDLFGQSSISLQQTFQKIPDTKGLDWFFLLLLSMSAIILLPRQFHVTVAENTNEQDIKTATWVFPLYLLLINLFVVPIALAGKLSLPATIDPDSYVLAMPLLNGNNGLALLTFLGGFSAATGMIIVSTSSLSTIASNNIFVPLFLKGSERKQVSSSLPMRSRRIAVFIILLLAYLYFKLVADRFSIVSIGLISFAAMIQFAPSVVGALFWKDANKRGALVGLTAGFILWGYTLVTPTLVEIGWLPYSLLTDGPFGIGWLNPHYLFGIQLSPIANGTFWSLLVNTSLFFGISLYSSQSAKERNMAELFVDIFRNTSAEERLVWKGQLVHQELIQISENLLGKERTQQGIVQYESIYGRVSSKTPGDARFVNYMERMLSGAIGAASARLLISSITKEEEIEIKDVVDLLKETSELSKLNVELKTKSEELIQRTKELESANHRLMHIDQEKDDFISTVTHELRTPLTSIKAFVEIIQDNPELAERDQFLSTINDEIDRMTRLINQVLDMEKLESGAVTIERVQILPHHIVEDSLTSMHHLLQAKNIHLTTDLNQDIKQKMIVGDQDRLKQVFINLISNSIKHSKEENAKIDVSAYVIDNQLEVSIVDNGKGIKEENLGLIFDKFFQARDQTRKKPKGTGLGLSITKKIVELHGGSIEVESTWEIGSQFKVKLPITEKPNE